MDPRDLSSHSVYRAGGGIEEVARELGVDPAELTKLASNENPFGPSPDASQAIRDHADRMHSYPKASHADLVAKLAEFWDVVEDQIWLGNGGDGVLDYLARAFLDPGDRVLVPRPGFAYYPMSARFHNADVGEYTLSKDSGFSQPPEMVLDAYGGERIVYLTSPHNPTGAEMALEDIEHVASETDDHTLLVVDEAYGEFSDSESAVSLVKQREDVAVLRTFSKVYGLAGIRLGYAITPQKWAEAYARVNTPFAASELACRAGIAALEDDTHRERTIETVRKSRATLRTELDAPTWESAGNFVLADVGDATEVAEAVKRRGVIIRDCTSFGLSQCIRITCGTSEETERAVGAINGVLAKR
jgi:histidinol-phosphate aminotransferase